MHIPVPKTVSDITDDTTNQQRQEWKVRVGSREHVTFEVNNRERLEVRVQDCVNETNVQIDSKYDWFGECHGEWSEEGHLDDII